MVEGKCDYSRTGLGGSPYIGLFGLDVAAISSNVTPHQELGIGKWTDDQIKTAITDGLRPDGRKLAAIMGFPCALTHRKR